MNNSRLIQGSVQISVEPPVDLSPTFREMESKLLKVVDALQEVQKTKAWSTLKTELFDGLVASLTKDLQNEAKKENPDTLKLNRLAGQLKWAERFSDLGKLEKEKLTELSNVRNKLHGKT